MNNDNRDYLNENKQKIISRYRYNQSLPVFINEINVLVIGDIHSIDFISNSMESDKHISHFIKQHPFYKATIRFSDLCVFKETMRISFPKLWSIPFLIRTERSQYCCMYRIPSLYSFNWAFPFDLNEGILSLISEDYLFEIILDWYEEDDNSLVDIMIKKQ